MRTALPAPAALAASGRRDLTELAQLLAAAKPGDSVHGARRRIKQLRSLLRLLRPQLGEDVWKGCNAALRDAAVALAGERRAEALVTAAAKLHDPPGAGFWLTQAALHRDAHAAAAKPADALKAAYDAILHARRQLEGKVVEDSCAPVSETFLATYARARKRLRAGLRSKAPAKLHDARKLVIHHLHHLKLLYPAQASRLAALEKLREVLGDLNDLDELEQLATGAMRPDADARRMRKMRKRLLDRAERAASRLFRHKAERFAKRLGHAGKPRSPQAPLALEAGE